MTVRRKWGTENAFNAWLRAQSEVSSESGYLATDLDFIWADRRSSRWMLLEIKCRKATLKPFQRMLFERLDKLCRADANYCGFHVLQLEGETPDAGRMWLDGREIGHTDLLAFLQFEVAEQGME